MPERYRLVLKDTDVNLSKMSYNEREELANIIKKIVKSRR